MSVNTSICDSEGRSPHDVTNVRYCVPHSYLPYFPPEVRQIINNYFESPFASGFKNSDDNMCNPTPLLPLPKIAVSR